MKLSEAIRKGIPLVPSSHTYAGCPLGIAYFAKTGIGIETALESAPQHMTGYEFIAKEFDVTPNIAVEIIRMFDGRGATREQCADWAELQGH